jgi:hypothetical protein
MGAAMCAATPAFAQNSATPDAHTPATQQGGMMMHGAMQGGMMQDMGPMMGQHMMNVTVTAVDIKTGLVDASAGNMALKLHFPPPSLAGVKAGDKLSVHLAFHRQ